MGAIVGTKQVLTEFAGEYKLVVLTATISSADDAITIAKASHGITNVYAIVGHAITGGADAAFSAITVTLTNSTTITITSVGEDGLAASDFTGTTVTISVLGI